MTLKSKARKTRLLLNTILPSNTWAEIAWISNRPKVQIRIRDGSNMGLIIARADAGDSKAYDGLAKLLMSRLIRWFINSDSRSEEERFYAYLEEEEKDP